MSADLEHTIDEVQRCCVDTGCVCPAARLLAALRTVRVERDALATQALILRSVFVNLRWDGPAWIKPHEHRAMEDAIRLAGGKPLDA